MTRSELDYEGSLSIDQNLMDAAGIVEFEAVHVWNVTNGQRLQTYAMPAERGTGEICINGAAARSAQCGDLVIIATFCWADAVVSASGPRIVLVDDMNRVRQSRM